MKHSVIGCLPTKHFVIGYFLTKGPREGVWEHRGSQTLGGTHTFRPLPLTTSVHIGEAVPIFLLKIIHKHLKQVTCKYRFAAVLWSPPPPLPKLYVYAWYFSILMACSISYLHTFSLRSLHPRKTANHSSPQQLFELCDSCNDLV